MTTQGSIQHQEPQLIHNLNGVQHQHQQQSVSLNGVIPSERTSPNGSSLNLLTNSNPAETRRTSIHNSPINLSSNLHNLSLSNSSSNLQNDQSQQTVTSPGQDPHNLHQQQYVVKVKNIPSDITIRESFALFAFAKDFVGLELLPDSNNLPAIYARFKTLSSASAYSQILESNQVFGPTYPFYLKAEIVDTSFQPILNLGASSAAKRPSIGAQRSRFLFSDPFANETITENIESNPNGVGKSMLLMESQQDAREYEQLVRDPWQQPSGQSQQQSVPQPSQAPNSSNSFSSNPQTPGVEWDRRKQGSAFFNNQSPLLATQLSSTQIPNNLSLSSQIGQPPSSQPINQSLSQTAIGLQPNSAPASQGLGVLSQPNSSIGASNPSTGSSQQLPQPSNVQSILNNSQQSSQVDLSLLARVPPPANPADQNPPCNTLYVGNLPPDATELELRQLFAPQRGFRRLSFKTKTQSANGTVGQTGHIHGPMCFVEFEDVAHATRALAELYGRTLPRQTGIPNKGGIRLSFSKNPLGVRGPGQRRSSGFQYQTGFQQK